MLNMMAMPAAVGGGLAWYLWQEATRYELLKTLAAGSGIDQLIAEGAGYEELIDLVYQERLARVQMVINPEPPENYIAAIRHLHGLGQPIDHELLRQKAVEDVDAAFARFDEIEVQRLAAFGVEYRSDTSPELVELLKIDLNEEPRLEDLKHLLSAKTADGGPIPGRIYRPDREDQMTMGSLEIILSADKSISVAEGLSPAEDRPCIRKAHRDAVVEAMHKLSEKCTVRNRKNGLDIRETADVTWVLWHHRFSRKGDPQMHSHISVLNVTLSQESGKVSTIDTFQLHGFYHAVREVYHRELARGLTELGMPVSYDVQKQATVLTGIPDHILKHFSGRTSDALDHLHKQGIKIEGLSSKELSWAMTTAASKTRQLDKIFYVPGNGHAAWHARAVGQGYVPPPSFADPAAIRAAQERAINQRQSREQRQLQALRPWMLETSGADALSPNMRASAERSYARWIERKPDMAKHSFEDYVAYVQEQWAKRPDREELFKLAAQNEQRRGRQHQPPQVKTSPSLPQAKSHPRTDVMFNRRSGRLDDDYITRRGIRL